MFNAGLVCDREKLHKITELVMFSLAFKLFLWMWKLRWLLREKILLGLACAV